VCTPYLIEYKIALLLVCTRRRSVCLAAAQSDLDRFQRFVHTRNWIINFETPTRIGLLTYCVCKVLLMTSLFVLTTSAVECRVVNNVVVGAVGKQFED